ncbi:MAG: hypothetical protein GY710_02010 [Desulfobacteraceae bacterium]|nr:hypothetical protein [Desulfobacteraceae bacterium]
MKYLESIILQITENDIDERREYMSNFEILANHGNENTREFNDSVSENIKPNTQYKITVEEL